MNFLDFFFITILLYNHKERSYAKWRTYNPRKELEDVLELKTIGSPLYKEKYLNITKTLESLN